MNSRRRQTIDRGSGGAPLRERRAEVKRTTNETDIAVTLDLDGQGVADVATGIGFLDHMLVLFAHHGGFDLTLRASGDLDVDGHHTVEDIGLALGQALREALGDKRGIRRYGSFLLPMDEALAMVALDLSGPALLRPRPPARRRAHRRVRRRPHAALLPLAGRRRAA